MFISGFNNVDLLDERVISSGKYNKLSCEWIITQYKPINEAKSLFCVEYNYEKKVYIFDCQYRSKKMIEKLCNFVVLNNGKVYNANYDNIKVILSDIQFPDFDDETEELSQKLLED